MRQTRDEHLWNQRFSAIENQLAELNRILTMIAGRLTDAEDAIDVISKEALADDELPDSDGDRAEL